MGSGSGEDSTGRGREAATGPNAAEVYKLVTALHSARQRSEVLSEEQASLWIPAQKRPLSEMGTAPSSPGPSPGHPSSLCPPHPPAQAALVLQTPLQGGRLCVRSLYPANLKWGGGRVLGRQLQHPRLGMGLPEVASPNQRKLFLWMPFHVEEWALGLRRSTGEE